MSTLRTRRLVYVALACATIGTGLWVHRGGGTLGDVSRDVAGDALWAMMIVWWMGALLPARRVIDRALVAYGICVAVELSQLMHTPALDAIRSTILGRLVLGSGFDPRDLVAYAGGVIVAAMLDQAVVSRSD